MDLFVKYLCLSLLLFMGVTSDEYRQDGEEPIVSDPPPNAPLDGASEAPLADNQGNGSTSGCGPYNVTGDCFPRNMDPFQRVTLKEKLEYFVPNLTQEYNDPRFQWFVELHNRHIVKPIKPMLPRADPTFLKLHYNSRGDVLPQTKRIEERPGPMYTFQGQEAECEPQYTFEKWPQQADDLGPPKEGGLPEKIPASGPDSGPCIRTTVG